jgi:hypothetical protein
VEAFAVWGGVPQYWELAADYPDLASAVGSLVLSPLGPLHDEPATLLLDDPREVTQAASLLTLIGRGCHRLSEIARRLGKPATSLVSMRYRIEENLPGEIAAGLLALGHDAQTAWEEGLQGAPDPALLERVRREGRVLLALLKVEVPGGWSS